MRPELRLRVREGLGHIVEGSAEVLVPAALRLLHSAAQHAQRLLLRQLRATHLPCRAASYAWTGAYEHARVCHQKPW